MKVAVTTDLAYGNVMPAFYSTQYPDFPVSKALRSRVIQINKESLFQLYVLS